MMISFQVRSARFFRNVLHGILGILAELMLVGFIVLSGFVVCVIWWGLLK